MWIVMAEYISGGHSSGQEWPLPNVPFEVADPEGRQLIQSGLARQIQPPEPAPAPEPAEQEAASPEASGALGASGEVLAVSLPAAEPLPPAPRATDPKSVWMDYAVSTGMDADDVVEMTKAELQSRFGGRL